MLLQLIHASSNAFTFRRIVAIPAASTPLISMMLRASQLLLFYENGSSRLWDIDAGQMQKSLSAAEAKEIVARMDGWESL